MAATTATRPSLTPAGVAVATGAVAFAVIGWAFGYVALTVVAAGGLAALVAGAVTTRRVPPLDVRRAIEPSRVERGRRAVGLVSVKNAGRRRSLACTAVERIVDAHADDNGRRTRRGRAIGAAARTVQVDIPPLRARRAIAVPYDIPTARRGALVVGPLTIVRHDPLGLWEARRPVGEAVTLLVQPHVHAVDPRRGGRSRHLEGPVSDTANHGVLTFHSLREYTPGDDVRRIHWKSSARTGTLMVREHVDTSQPSAVVVVDMRRARYVDEAFEEAVDVAASVVAASQARGFPVRLVTTTGQSYVVRAGQRGQDLQDFLTTVALTDDGSMTNATTEVLRGREHDAITVISGTVDSDDLASVTRMARGFASSSLVTVRPKVADAPRWTGGLHLDGVDAASALVPWRTVKPVRASEPVA